MKLNLSFRKALSILLSVVVVFSCMTMIAYAAPSYAVEIYKDGEEVKTKLEIEEATNMQLEAVLTKGEMPEGGQLVWSTDTPYLASVDETGMIRAHDSSKGPIIRVWIDQHIAPIWLVGEPLAEAMYKQLDDMDLDALDTDGIMNIMRFILQDILFPYDDDSDDNKITNSLINSLLNTLQKMLDTLHPEITVTLYDANGKKLASDTIDIVVRKSTKWYGDFIPNGTFITNKAILPETVEVGYSTQMLGTTTPLRLHMGVSWNLDLVSSLMGRAKIEADGTITFLKAGTVTVTASPDVEGFLRNIERLIVFAEEAGDFLVNGDLIATIIVDGFNLKNIDKEALGDSLDGVVEALKTNPEARDAIIKILTPIMNIVLYATVNDKYTFTVVDDLQITDFDIVGKVRLRNGKTSQLGIQNVKPEGAYFDPEEIIWSVDKPDAAFVYPGGLMIARYSGAGTRDVNISATVDGVTKSVKGNIWGGVQNMHPTDLVLTGPTQTGVGDSVRMTYEIYPDALWGDYDDVEFGLMVDGSIKYGDVSDGIVQLNGRNITGLKGGTTTIYAKTDKKNPHGDYIYRSIEFTVIQPAEGFSIDQGSHYSYKLPTSKPYYNSSVQLTVSFYPPETTDKTLVWTSSNSKMSVDSNGKVTNKSLSAQTALITATTPDGKFTDSCQVTIANNIVTSVTISPRDFDLALNSTKKLAVSINPSNAKFKNVSWVSDNPAVATVSSDGTVAGHAYGEALITVISLDGGLKDSVLVTVTADKSALEAALKLAADYDESKFEADVWAQYVDAVNTASDVYADKAASQSAVDQAVIDLLAALERMSQTAPATKLEITYNGSAVGENLNIKVGVFKLYKNCPITLGYEFDGQIKSLKWTTSDSSNKFSVTNGVVRSTYSTARSANITLIIEDFAGNVYTDVVRVRFHK